MACCRARAAQKLPMCILHSPARLPFTMVPGTQCAHRVVSIMQEIYTLPSELSHRNMALKGEKISSALQITPEFMMTKYAPSEIKHTQLIT